VSDPSLADSLFEFLRAKRCVVEPVGETTLDVALPDAGREEAAILELELYLRVWEAIFVGQLVEREWLEDGSG
jgi:hypothetical protein